MIIWKVIGRLGFWLAWPIFKLKLRTTTRTRVIIQHHNQILVVKNWLGSGKWGLPGGGVKINEDSLTSALREVKEEVGFTLKRKDCNKLGNFEYESNGLTFVYSLYKVRINKVTDIKRQKLEITEAQWIDTELLSAENSASDVLQALKVIK